MKQTKQILLTTIVIVSLFAGIIITSCTKPKDACAGIVCQNGGSCNGGNCVCPSGYTGTYCQIAISTAYYGTWKGTDCSGAATYYITSAGSPTLFTLTIPITFTDCGTYINVPLNATINTSTNIFSTNSVGVNDGCGHIYTFTASGYTLNGALKVTTVVTTSTGSATCDFNGTKQ